MAPREPKTLDHAPSGPNEVYQQTLLGRIDQRFLSTPIARIALLVILAAILIVPAVQAAVRIREIDRSLFRAEGERHKTALGRWLPSAGALEKGTEDPYGYGHWFPTPPLVLMALVPFLKMGYAAAGVIWAALKVAGFVAAMAFLISALRRSGLPVPTGLLLAAGIFSIRPIVSDLQHANLNIFVLIWVALAWGLYIRGNDFWAGVFTALAIVTKITPGLMLLYFLYKREWRVGIGAVVGLVLLVLVIPGAYIGWSRNMQFLREWFDMIVAPFAFGGWATFEIANQSLYGTLLRVLSNAHLLSIEHMPADQAMAAGMEDMARPLTALGRLIRPVLSLGILGSLALLCRGRIGRRHDIRRWLEFALILIAMLLMGERTWKHHATTLPIVYLAYWCALACLPWTDRFRQWHVAGLAVQFVLLVAGGEGFMGKRIADMMLDGGFFCWGLVLLGVQTAVLLAALDRSQRTTANA